MPKTKISEFSATPGNNTDIDGINIAEGCAPSGINDAIRELMAQLKDFQAGTAGDSFNGPVGTTTAAAGAFTNLSASGTFALTGDQVQISEGGTGQTTANAAFNALAPSQTSNAGKYLKTDGTNTSWDALDISTADITGTLPVANGGTGVTSSTGTGSVVLSASPTFTGTVNGASLTLSSNFTLSGGTANGVAYLNGSKVLTTGSALTFDGTLLSNAGASSGAVLEVLRLSNNGTGDGTQAQVTFRAANTNYAQITGGFSGGPSLISNVSAGGYQAWQIAASEGMRLTSSGLEVKQSQLIGYSSYAGIGTNGLAVAGNVGIGTSSPTSKLTIGTGTYSAAASGTTGMYSFAGGLVVLSDGVYFASRTGGDKMTLDSSGNLGIGTSSPAYRVDASGQVRALEGGTGSGDGGFVASTSGANGNAGVLFQTNSASRWNLTTSGTNGANLRIYNYALGSTVATFDSSGNLGLGVTPSAWGSNFKAIQGFSNSQFGLVASTNSVAIGTNYYHDNTNYIYTTTGQNAARYDMTSAGVHRWFTAPSGTAGNIITFTQALTLTAAANLLLGGTSDPGGEKALYIANTSSVPGTPTGGGVLYVEGGALKYKGSSGTVTTIANA